MALLDDELQTLYALRPDDFVRARNELARALRKEGRRDDADVAAKLRRPSVTAAALNHVAREEPELVEALLREEGHLRDAMQRAVQGNADDVRPARAAERRAAAAVVTAARRRLEQLGQHDTDAAAQRISNTLRAAALDDSLSQRLRRGMLDTDVMASGFGFGGIVFDVGIRAPAPRKKAARGVERDAAAPPDSRAQQREAAARRAPAQTEAKHLAAAAAKLATVADKAQRQLEELREQATLIQERVRSAERDARRTRQAADKGAADAARARERADSLEGAVIDAQ
ncbi:MAG TPA: hypothetical protein VM282_03145 [Acidimicrobiales bacterium]|nr:hypothetical protein [Acidimicrobiales bacterium]